MGVWFFKKTKLHNRFAGWVFPLIHIPFGSWLTLKRWNIFGISAHLPFGDQNGKFLYRLGVGFAGIDGKIKHKWWIPGGETIRSIGSSDQYIVGVRLGSWQKFNKCHLSICTAKLSGKCQTVCNLHDSPPSVQQFGPFWRCISLVISCCTLLLWKLLIRPWNPIEPIKCAISTMWGPQDS